MSRQNVHITCTSQTDTLSISIRNCYLYFGLKLLLRFQIKSIYFHITKITKHQQYTTEHADNKQNIQQKDNMEERQEGQKGLKDAFPFGGKCYNHVITAFITTSELY